MSAIKTFCFCTNPVKSRKVIFILLSLLFLAPAKSISTSLAENIYDPNITCLFDWMENEFPGYLSPAGQLDDFKTYHSKPFILRCYQFSNSCIAAWEDILYFAGKDSNFEVVELGKLIDWHLYSGCVKKGLNLYEQKRVMNDPWSTLKRWDQVSIPYYQSRLSRTSLINNNTINHGKYKILATGKAFTISDLIAQDLYGNTWAIVQDLANNTTIGDGEEVEFTLLSGVKPNLPSKIHFQIQEASKGTIFEVYIELRPDAYPLIP